MFGVNIWVAGHPTDVAKIERMQDKSLIYVHDAQPPIDNYRKLSIFRFNSLYSYITVLKMYKYLNSGSEEFFSNKFLDELPNHQHSTKFRVSGQMNKTFPKSGSLSSIPPSITGELGQGIGCPWRQVCY